MSVECQETIEVGDPVRVSSQHQNRWLEALGEVLDLQDGGNKIVVRLIEIYKQHGVRKKPGCEITVGSREVELYTGDQDKYA